MEQRNSQRKVVTIDAVLACQRFGMIRGRITDMAEGGLYLKAETRIVPLGARVSVTFQPGEGVCQDCLTIPGRVVHQSLHGLGIKFDALDPACRTVLARLLPLMPPVPNRSAAMLRAV